MNYKQIGGNRQNIPKKWTLKDGSQTGNFDLMPEDTHKSEGWYQCNPDPPNPTPETHRMSRDDEDELVDGRWERRLISLTAEEYNDKRNELLRTAYLQAEQKQSAAASNYSPAETIRWAGWVSSSTVAKAADDNIAGSGDWTFLKTLECGEAADCSGCVGLACQVYGNDILNKHSVLEAYSDAVVLARNAHKKAIAATPDADLATYDTSQFWPEVVSSDILYSTN